MNRDIEETRERHKQMREMELLVNKVADALSGQPSDLAIGALTSYLGRALYVTNTPVDSIAVGLNLIIAMCGKQEQQGEGK